MNTYGLLGDVTGTPHPDPTQNNRFAKLECTNLSVKTIFISL